MEFQILSKSDLLRKVKATKKQERKGKNFTTTGHSIANHQSAKRYGESNWY